MVRVRRYSSSPSIEQRHCARPAGGPAFNLVGKAGHREAVPAVRKTWATLRPEDRDILQKVGEEIMTEQKKDARGVNGQRARQLLEKIYQMEVTAPTPARYRGVSTENQRCLR